MSGPTNPLSLAQAHFQAGRLAAAEACCREVLRTTPAEPQASSLLAILLRQRGDHAAAVAALDRAILTDPGSAILHFQRGCSLPATEAAPSFRRAVLLQPHYVKAAYNLAVVLKQAEHLPAALGAARHAVMIQPELAAALLTCGSIAVQLEQPTAASALFRRALRLSPGLLPAWHALSGAQVTIGRFEDAVRSCRQGLCLDPAEPALLSNLGSALIKLGRHHEGIAATRAAVRMRPEDHFMRARLMLRSTYAGEDRPSLPLAATPPVYRRPHTPDDPERRLRIGVLSSDLRDHVAGHVHLPLFSAINRTRFEIYCYPSHERSDEITAAWQRQADGWRPINHLDDRAAAELICRDGIDILIACCGHLDGNRLQICRHRAAPIQVSFGDVCRSNLTEVDYLLGDPLTTPRVGGEPLDERAVRLPGPYFGAWRTDLPDPGPPPSAAAGFITFGSFNNPSKITQRTLALWGGTLAAVPGSRLILKYRNYYEDLSLRARFLAVLGQAGIAPDRVRFAPANRDRSGHLAGYHEIDIALDTLPYNGQVTTAEALSMGVPVVTLRGGTIVGAAAAAVLRTLGLRELIATNQAGFVAICRQLAAQPERLAAYRTEIRARIPGSPLFDTALRARQHERLYRAFWRRWCAAATPPSHP